MTKKIFGYGDFNKNPQELSPYLVEDRKSLIKLGQHVSQQLKNDLEDNKDVKDMKVGLEVCIGQFVECRFPASLISPLLPYLVKIPGLVSLAAF